MIIYNMADIKAVNASISKEFQIRQFLLFSLGNESARIQKSSNSSQKTESGNRKKKTMKYCKGSLKKTE